MTQTTHSKWTATIEIPGEQPVAADPSQWDTLRETTDAAIREAAEYLRAGMATEARVHLHKQLASWPEPVWDRQGAYLWLERGQVMVQR